MNTWRTIIASVLPPIAVLHGHEALGQLTFVQSPGLVVLSRLQIAQRSSTWCPNGMESWRRARRSWDNDNGIMENVPRVQSSPVTPARKNRVDGVGTGGLGPFDWLCNGCKRLLYYVYAAAT